MERIGEAQVTFLAVLALVGEEIFQNLQHCVLMNTHQINDLRLIAVLQLSNNSYFNGLGILGSGSNSSLSAV